MSGRPSRCWAGAAALAACLGLAAAAPGVAADQPPPLELELQGAMLAGGTLRLEIRSPAAAAEPQQVTVLTDGAVAAHTTLPGGSGELTLPATPLGPGEHRVTVWTGGRKAETTIRVIPGWLSVVPPLIAIGLALVFREVLVSLFAGVFAGALILGGWNPFVAFGMSIDRFVVEALIDGDHVSILVFTTLLGGMVGLINRSGGTRGIVERLTPWATNARRGQLATWLMGVLVFFDDYANTLIVGSTMRPITDRLKVSREKLAYIVDSTAAPVASVAPISTWIGFEVGLIAAAFAALELPFNAYEAFIASIPYRFYPIFALVLGFTLAALGRDFGPMLRAEQRATATGKVVADDATPLADFSSPAQTPPEGAPLRAINALLPIATVVVVTVIGLYLTGRVGLERASFDSALTWIREIFSAADSFQALLWASLAGAAVGLVLPLAQRILTLKQAMEALSDGFKAMLLALVVLTLAWSIGAVCAELHTADYVIGLTRGVVSAHWLPVLTFAVSAGIAFATGTSWGTMAILMPLVIPIAHGLAGAGGYGIQDPLYYTLMIGTISSVLAGSVWGDHCSPISDTTILSSLASGCDHIAHVRTQVPYAIAIGMLGMAIGDIPTAFGLSPWISLGVGSALIVGLVLWKAGRDDLPGPYAVAATE